MMMSPFLDVCELNLKKRLTAKERRGEKESLKTPTNWSSSQPIFQAIVFCHLEQLDMIIYLQVLVVQKVGSNQTLGFVSALNEYSSIPSQSL